MLGKFNYLGREVIFRIGTTDENCINEVLVKKSYRNKNVPFNVEKGEVWLDLGAHIGTFTIYAYSCGATKVYCFEGDSNNFSILGKNCLEAEKFNMFFTGKESKSVSVYLPTRKTDFYRFSIIGNKRFGYCAPNFYAKDFKEKIDGIKMDIEGAEMELIDKELLPIAKKLTFEYHFSKDSLMENFFKRMDLLRKRFKKVYYQPSIERLREKGVKEWPGFYDIKVYCVN